MGFKIIAVDFDGTLCENKWPEIGEPNVVLIAYLKERQVAGDKLVLWTCRVGEILKNAIDWSTEQGIIFDAVNENLQEVLEWVGGDSRKIFANEYIDDRNAWYPQIISEQMSQSERMELWGGLIDVMEDWLEEKGITANDIPNEERKDTEDAAIIYGSDYDYLADRFAAVVGISRDCPDVAEGRMSCRYKNECPSYSGWCEGSKQDFSRCIPFLSLEQMKRS